LSFFVCDGTVITSVMGAALPLLLGVATGDGRAAGLTRGGVVLTVNADRDVVERQLGGGELACPSCGGVLARWGNGAARRTVARWQLAAAVTCGLLLAPAWPARVANTSWLWAAPR
jgi:hypothetical protein